MSLRDAAHDAKRLILFGVGSASSMGLSFAVAAIASSRLSSRGFTTVNLVLATAAAAASAGSGVDSAAVRLMARYPSSADGLYSAAVRLRAIVGSVAVVAVGTYMATWATAHTGDAVIVTVSFAAVTAAGSATMLLLVPSQVVGDAASYARRQFLASVCTTVPGIAILLMSPRAPQTLAGVALAAVVWAAAVSAQLPRPRRTSGAAQREFTQLSRYLLASTVMYAAIERIDLVTVTAAVKPSTAAIFAAAQRLAGVVALATTAEVTLLAPRVASMRSITPRTLTRTCLYPAIICVIALIVGIALLRPVGPVLFAKYASATPAAQLYALQYIPILLYMPLVLAFPHIGGMRWQLEVPIVMLVAELIWLAVALKVHPTPTTLVLASPVAHIAGLVDAVVRFTQGARRSTRSAAG